MTEHTRESDELSLLDAAKAALDEIVQLQAYNDNIQGIPARINMVAMMLEQAIASAEDGGDGACREDEEGLLRGGDRS